jgi:hypothetical protein
MSNKASKYPNCSLTLTSPDARRITRFGVVLLLALAPSILSHPALAAVSENEVTIAARTLGFLEKPLTGEVRVGIVVAPDDARSSRDAVALQKFMSGGLRVGGLTLKPVMVPIDGIDGIDGASVDLLFLTEGLGARASKAGAFGRAKRIPCITLDIDQVRNGNCAIGVKSNPRVEILVNRDAAAQSGVSFAGAFKMLITDF